MMIPIKVKLYKSKSAANYAAKRLTEKTGRVHRQMSAGGFPLRYGIYQANSENDYDPSKRIFI